MMGAESVPVMNGTGGVHGGDDYQRWMESRAAHEKPSPATHRHGAETFSNTLPVRKVAPIRPKNTMGKMHYSNSLLNLHARS